MYKLQGTRQVPENLPRFRCAAAGPHSDLQASLILHVRVENPFQFEINQSALKGSPSLVPSHHAVVGLDCPMKFVAVKAGMRTMPRRHRLREESFRQRIVFG